MLRALLALLVVPTGGACDSDSRLVAAGSPHTRVLLVTIDTLRADHVGAYGGPVPTRAIDGLAYTGALLTDAFTPTPSTLPAHASLLTGLHPWHHRVLDNAIPLPDGVRTIAELARAAGFASAAFVSSYVLHERFGLARGFDTYHFAPRERYRWRGEERPAFWTRGSETTDAALAWLGKHRDEPFFVWVHYFDPHSPYEAPAGFERPSSERVALDDKQLPPGVASLTALSDMIRAYRAEVVYTDAELGRLLEGLRSLGLFEATAIVVTADHGEGLGDHGVLEHGENLFDELVRVPLVIRAPGVPPGRRLGGAVQLEDLAPTLLALLGIPSPGDLDGFDLMPWVRGEVAAPPRDAVLGRRKPYRDRPDHFYERHGSAKWIGSLESGGVVYDLARDPNEADGKAAPVSPSELEGARAARAALPTPAPAIDAEVRRALEALGYTE